MSVPGFAARFADLDARDRYKLLCAIVVPRPVAFVTTLGPDGTVNAAPFSFFVFDGWSLQREKSGACPMVNRILSCTSLVLALTVAVLSSASAQSRPAPKTIETVNSTLLAPDKQQRVKEFVRQQQQLKGMDPLSRSADSFAAGMPVSEEIQLFALPEDTMTEVPRVTSYQFFLARNGIVVVDPTSRRVVQVIP